MSISLRLAGHRLTTAEILYRIPDHPRLVQTFIWQDFDVAPDFPQLTKFLRFWHVNLEGKLYSVRVASRQLIADHELNLATLLC